jgi:hypothetical protein
LSAVESTLLTSKSLADDLSVFIDHHIRTSRIVACSYSNAIQFRCSWGENDG